MNKKNLVYDLLHKCELGVLAYLGKQYVAQAAIVGFGETSDLKLIFGTYNDTRKYEAIRENRRVAFVVEKEGAAIQYEGLISELGDSSEDNKLKQAFFAKNPKANIHHKNERYFAITPKWIRYVDINKSIKFEIADFI